MEQNGIDTGNWHMLAEDNAAWCDALGVKFKPDYQLDVEQVSDGFGPLTIPDDQRIINQSDLVIYTDGSCIGNKKVRSGGYTAGCGAVVILGASGHRRRG